MRTSPAVEQSNQSRSSPSLARQWATRLVLLVACAASVATSRAQPIISQEHQGTPLTLRADAPPTSLRLRVRVSAQKPLEHTSHLYLQASILATWRPDSPTSSRAPLLRTRMVITPESAESSPWQQTFDFQSPNGPKMDEVTLYPSTMALTDCSSQLECVWYVALQFEVDPQGAEGAITLKSHFAGNVEFRGGDGLPEGTTLEITEE